MMSILFGVFCLLFVAYAIIPFPNGFGLGWTDEFIYVLKGGVPLIVIGLGFLCLLVGIADIIDRRHAIKEAQLQEKFEKEKES